MRVLGAIMNLGVVANMCTNGMFVEFVIYMLPLTSMLFGLILWHGPRSWVTNAESEYTRKLLEGRPPSWARQSKLGKFLSLSIVVFMCMFFVLSLLIMYLCPS